MSLEMSTSALISVAMPAYNHARYVEAAVRSVLEQDWPRLELVVIDDGSSDATWEVFQHLRPECEARCERAVMMRQANAGLVSAGIAGTPSRRSCACSVGVWF